MGRSKGIIEDGMKFGGCRSMRRYGAGYVEFETQELEKLEMST
jgi:hypothetical protein